MKKAFVIMPFKEKLQWVYDEVIKYVCKKLNIHVKRADEMNHQRSIMRDIVEGIILSDVVIADLTGNNPNVFYELGAAHSLLRPVIILTQNIKRLPFDLKSHRVIPYSVDTAKKELFREKLSSTLKETLQIEMEPSNPVGEYMPITFRSRLVQANRHSKPVGYIHLWKDGNKAIIEGQGILQQGLVIEPSYPIRTIHWGSLVTGWGWDGKDAISTELLDNPNSFLLSGIPTSSIGDIRGTPYIRTVHNELIYFDLYMWDIHPRKAFQRTESSGQQSAIIEFPFEKLEQFLEDRKWDDSI